MVLEILQDTKTTVLSYSDLLMIIESKPCVISKLVRKIGEKTISAMQFSNGFKQCTLIFYTLRLEEIDEATGLILIHVKRLIHEFEHVMSNESPKRLLAKEGHQS
ncbi:Uncharacterized protein Adt_15131 [Abeliophyllum distichum]|uniref:Uncharacterized protein n=1 Tax=Abeliophyllum distichum TaxID=126358 RepID=A0ABD1U1N6_9LAMI